MILVTFRKHGLSFLHDSHLFVYPLTTVIDNWQFDFHARYRFVEAWLESNRAPLRVSAEVPEYQKRTFLSQIKGIGFWYLYYQYSQFGIKMLFRFVRRWFRKPEQIPIHIVKQGYKTITEAFLRVRYFLGLLWLDRKSALVVLILLFSVYWKRQDLGNIEKIFLV